MNDKEKKIEKIISLAKRRGLVFPSSEIYGGFAGVYDYGPIGVHLANNLKAKWWSTMVLERADIVGLDSAIFMHPKVWMASGHVSSFSDPLVECKKCNARHRADHLLMNVDVIADEKMTEEEIGNIFVKNKDKIKCPTCGKNSWTSPKLFNLLVTSNLGNFSGEGEDSYLRGETAQGMYLNYKNVLDSMHLKIPFGIAQIGKAFRNEITPRQFLFRTREFEQMEMQYFVHPKEAFKAFTKLRADRMDWMIGLGLKKDNLRWKKHDNLVFYAKDAFDIEYNFPFDWKEIEGVHARGDYDLTEHSKHSGVDLSYLDQENKEKFIPNIVESSIGVGRLFFAILVDAYTEEEVGGDMRVVLKLNKDIAPIKVAVLPLSKKIELTKGAMEIYNTLKKKYVCRYDETQSIGKRYRRQDEIGTPYCITFDFDSLTDKCVTVRDRDSMSQKRIKIIDIQNYLNERFYNE